MRLRRFIAVLCVCSLADDPTQISSVAVAVKILDVNDNAPSLTHYLEAYVCENAKAGQVRRHGPTKKTTLNVQFCTKLCRLKPQTVHEVLKLALPQLATTPVLSPVVSFIHVDHWFRRRN